MLQNSYFMEKLNSMMEWVARFFILQLIWILFSFAGLIIGGIFPATFTMFALCRKWINKQTEVPTFKTFWEVYRKNFLKTNFLGWIIILTGSSLYYYFQLVKELSGTIGLALFIAVWIVGILYIMTVLFIIPVYVHFDIPMLHVAKYALIIAIAHPFHVLSMAGVITGFCIVVILIPGLFPFFSFSLLAYALMWLANIAFKSMERKKNKSGEINQVVLERME